MPPKQLSWLHVQGLEMTSQQILCLQKAWDRSPLLFIFREKKLIKSKNHPRSRVPLSHKEYLTVIKYEYWVQLGSSQCI